MSELPGLAGSPERDRLRRRAREVLRDAVGGDDRALREAEELIDGQYDDRPQLRAVLDRVLTALPPLGPVTVLARRTVVSLSTPRRVFAVVAAMTRSRVDLGLRLEHEGPGGRLLAARNLGPSTVRIALSRHQDVDAEVLGCLRRAYKENAAPPPPRRPSRRPAPKLGPLTVVIEASGLPGRSWPGAGEEHRNVHIALYTKSTERPALAILGNPWLAAGPVPGDSPTARWEAPILVRRDADGFDFSGPYVRGDRTDRHLGIVWGDLGNDGTLRPIRGNKLRLGKVDPGLIQEAMRPGCRLVARIRLTGAPGEPGLTWSAEPAGPEQAGPGPLSPGAAGPEPSEAGSG
ncbi:MAG: hypothetical protein J2P30_06445 [Actinobacteria bacterium]|nr:hypothetical protein [Actinomycetota bacterium]